MQLITNARVRTLTPRPDGLVGGAIYLDAQGAEHAVKAPHAGVIGELRVRAGEQVEGGVLLAIVTEAGEDETT